MSNRTYVKELCGLDTENWVCEQLADDLDKRDRRIEELTSALHKCVGAVIHTDSDRAVAEIVHKALGGE